MVRRALHTHDDFCLRLLYKIPRNFPTTVNVYNVKTFFFIPWTGLASFFKSDSSLGQARQETIRRQNELINASKGGLKRARPQIQLEDEEAHSRKDDISAAQYSQAGGGQRASAAVSIFSSSSSGICFNSDAAPPPPSSSNHQSSSFGGNPRVVPARKKLKIVVKGFPTAAEEGPADENSPHNR